MNDVWRQRYMLALFVWIAALQAMSWTPLAAVGQAIAMRFFPGVTSGAILQQLNWGPIAQMVMTPVAVSVIGHHKKGLTRSLRAACILAVGTCLLRLVPALVPALRNTGCARLLLQASGIACGFSASFIQGAPSHFSVLWFPPEQRGRATAAAFLGTPFGLALGYALPALLVGDDADMTPLLLVKSLLGAPPLLAVALYCPNQPASAWWLTPADGTDGRRSGAHEAAPGYTSEQEAGPGSRCGGKAWRRAVWAEAAQLARQLRQLAGCPSFVLVACACAVGNGPYQARIGALPDAS